MKCKKQIAIGVIILLLGLVFTTTSKATTAVVNTDTLKLRKEASTDSTVLELLNDGQKMDVIEESGNWVKVKVNGITGYVHKDYVKINKETTTTTNENTTNTNSNQNEDVNNETVVETENTIEDSNVSVYENNNNVVESNIGKQVKLIKDVKVYILPLINSNVIDSLKKDGNVTVIDEVNGWSYIETEKINGWIRNEAFGEKTNSESDNSRVEEKTTVEEENADNTKQEETATATNNSTEFKTKYMYVNYPSIYVRKGPSTSEEVVDTLILNNQVKVTGESGDWYKVEVDGKTGYIAKRLLSNSTQEETSRSAEERNTDNDEQEAVITTTSNTSKGQEIVNYAKQYLKCRYVYGGSGPSTFDCSGFTMYVYKHFGISLSHSATAQSKNGTYVAKENLQPGDLVFFKDYETMDGIGHVGIYIGDGNFIHASSGTGYCVKISTLLSGSYLTRYETARRLI